jgi:DNA-directed RNA polymerase subunit RPC12/RpoP
MDDGMSAADGRIVAGESVADALRLDGNAAAGILSEIFVPDLTAARATCAHCGATREIGALMVYAHGMGTVVRCPSCDSVVLCVTRTPTLVWLDATGARRIVLAAAALPA